MTRSLLIALLALVLPVGGAVADGSPQPQRLYLLEASTGDGYWSVDPSDPELQAGTAYRTCGEHRELAETAPCQRLFRGDGYRYGVHFLPASLIDGLTQGGTVRFRLHLDVSGALAFTVRVGIVHDGNDVVSAPATEVSPGVWEGEFKVTWPLSGTFNTIAAYVDTASPGATLTIGAAGASWLELPHGVQARGVPQLVRDAPRAQIPTTYEGGGRRVWFNDDDWTAYAFSGDLREARAFEFALPRDAALVLAWVQTYDSPLVYDLVRGRQPDARRLENSPYLELERDGETVAKGTNSGIRGRGQDNLAAFEQPAGPVRVHVEPSSWDPDRGGQELAYTAHVIAVHGSRTLAGMRSRFGMGDSLSTPFVSACPYPLEAVPVTAEVTTFSAELDWHTEARPDPRWTLSFDIPSTGSYPCGELTIGRRIRFTLPSHDRVWMLGPAPAGRYVSFNDTIFELHVAYTYAPPAPAP